MSLAATANAQGIERARALFEAGRVAVSEGDYEAALRHFTESHELSQRPQLLFNMANAADRLRRDQQALELYRRYLEELPEADNAAYVLARIDALSGTEPPPAPDPEPEPVVEPPPVLVAPVPPPRRPPPEREPPIAGIATLAAGAAFAVTGAILVGVAASERASVDGAPIGSRWSEYEGSHQRANTLAPIGGVLLGLGVAAAATGVALVVVHDGEGEASVAIAPWGAGALVRGTF
ncbi:MAG: hypothetical protein KF729_28230 [Sandaracinaceae bacterium]|nr:hypothetical protein [Sandaracinaceae bacterium]